MARKDAQPGAKEAATERRGKALVLRQSGATFAMIARQLTISEGQAYKDVQTELQRLNTINRVNAEELRRLEDLKLDAIELAISTQVRNGHLGAIDRKLRVMDRRAKLWGLDAPTRLDTRTYDMSGWSDAELDRAVAGDDPAQILKDRRR